MSGKTGNISRHKQDKHEQDFRALAENVPDIIGRFDKELRHIYVNPAVERATGISRNSFIGKTNSELGMPENLVRLWDNALQTVFETGQENIIVFDFMTPGGKRYFESRLVPESAEDGSVDSVLFISRDFTEQKRIEEELHRAHEELEIRIKERTAELKEANMELEKANIELESRIEEQKRIEEALRESQSSLAKAQSIAHIGSWSRDFRTAKVTWSDEMYRIFGINPVEFNRDIETVIARAIHPDDREKVLESNRQALSEHIFNPLEYRLILPDGKERVVWAEGELFFDASGNVAGVLGTVQDITERKQAEKKIQEQAALLDKARDAIGVRDMEHRLIYWNKGAQRLYGWKAEEVIGRKADEFLYKGEWPELFKAKKGVIENGEWNGKLRQVTKKGEEITVESRWTLVYDDEGKPKSILIINTDITGKEKLEAQLLRSQRMESIGTLAGGIAHDLNNVLTPIMLSLQMLRGKLTDEQSQKLLAILERNSQRGADLIKQVLSFARGVEGEHNPLQIKHSIIETEKIAKETFPKNIELRIKTPRELWTISGDATQLHQVMMNICVNARDAMPHGGILDISAKNVIITQNHAQMNTEAKEGKYVVISISDTGIGIPPEILDRIFEPFFTTKEQGKGTGLGLSTVIAIVKSHGGFIDVHSIVGEGTTFKVYLPAVKAEIQETGIEQPELYMGNEELILVAEDEESIRKVTTLTLETHGYKVLSASDGAEAVALYTENIDKIRVILMDILMPIMDGQTSIRAIHKINSKAKIIAVSGLAEKDKLDTIRDARIQAFLPKPYTAEGLLKSIHDVLSAH